MQPIALILLLINLVLFAVALALYRLLRRQSEEMHKLSEQMVRAASAVPTDAEGMQDSEPDDEAADDAEDI